MRTPRTYCRRHAALYRLELLAETMRTALNALAQAAPDWLTRVVETDWFRRYGARAEDSRFPKPRTKRNKMAERIGRDGMRLLQAQGSAGHTRAVPCQSLRPLPPCTLMRQLGHGPPPGTHAAAPRGRTRRHPHHPSRAADQRLERALQDPCRRGGAPSPRPSDAAACAGPATGAWTSLQHQLTGAAINLARIDAHLTGTPRARTRTSHFAARCPADARRGHNRGRMNQQRPRGNGPLLVRQPSSPAPRSSPRNASVRDPPPARDGTSPPGVPSPSRWCAHTS